MNTLNSTFDITDEEDRKNTSRIRFKLVGTSQIIRLNYRTLIEEKGVEYYYDLYKKRCEEQNIDFTTIENFSKDLDLLIEKYCDFLSKKDKTLDELSNKSKIYSIYQELINESENMGNDKIVNKV